MGDLLTIDNLQLFLTFAVPGIVTVYFRSQFLTGRMPPLTEGLASYVVISLVYQAFVLGLLIEPSKVSLFDDLGRWQWSLLVFVVPAIIGIVSGLNVRHGWSAKLLSRVRANTVHPIECAWDWRFSNCKECWALVKLKDGTRWVGVLGENSFLSSDPHERDLFMEKVYLIGEGDAWSANTSSVWIGHSEIHSIEMWPKSKEKSHGQRN